MRVMKNPTRIKAMNSYGASAVPISWPELYGAVETGVVDGFELSYEGVRMASLYEVVKYFSESFHSLMSVVVVGSEKFYQSLPSRQERLFRDVSSLAGLRYMHLFEELDAKAKRIIKEKGVTVSVVPDAVRKDLRKAVQPLYVNYAKKYGSDLIDRIKAAE